MNWDSGNIISLIAMVVVSLSVYISNRDIKSSLNGKLGCIDKLENMVHDLIKKMKNRTVK